MFLPENENPIKIKYYFADGWEYVLDEEEIKKYEANIRAASDLAIIHGYKFRTINWRKVRK